MASTSSKHRRASFRSVSTQYRRSSRNSGWKTASRFRGASAFRIKAQLRPQILDSLRCLHTSTRSLERGEQALRVARGPQQVSTLEEALELVGCDEGDVFAATSTDQNDLAVVDRRIEEFRQVGACGGVGRFDGHRRSREGTCTAEQYRCTR